MKEPTHCQACEEPFGYTAKSYKNGLVVCQECWDIMKNYNYTTLEQLRKHKENKMKTIMDWRQK